MYFLSPRGTYACDEETNGSLCIFHDKANYEQNKSAINQRLYTKVIEIIREDKPLELVGHCIPHFSFTPYLNKKTLDQQADFSDAKFFGQANFGEVKFSKEAYFVGAEFSREAFFVGATFHKDADFSKCVFSKGSYFAGASFLEKSRYNQATFIEEGIFDRGTFSKGVDFTYATFSKKAGFEQTKLLQGAKYVRVKFLDEAYFMNNEIKEKAYFRYVIFEEPNKVIFDDNDLSKVSFAGTDITKIRFGDKITWGAKDKATIIEEEWLKNKMKVHERSQSEEEKDKDKGDEDVSLGLVVSIYRNLRENYELRLRYDEAGEFFIKEMELKRKYRHVSSKRDLNLIALDRKIKRNKGPLPKVGDLVENSWLRRNLLSLTGIYHLISNYGESVLRPTIIGGASIILPALIWTAHNSEEWQNNFERSLSAFLPFLPFESEIEIGIEDYLIKGTGALTFGLLIIALRRRFERKYTR